MITQIAMDYEWLYPDLPVSKPISRVFLEGARGTRACFQILTDVAIDAQTPVTITTSWHIGVALPMRFSQLVSVRVEENTGVKLFTTTDYESVKDFVTRPAPFRVFDALLPVSAAPFQKEERAAFFIIIDIPLSAEPGDCACKLNICIDREEASVEVFLKVYPAIVPATTSTTFSCNTHLNQDDLCSAHGVDLYSEAFYIVLDKYLIAQVETRNNVFLLPLPLVIRDTGGKVTGFDFAQVERIGKRAFELGMKEVIGHYLSSWRAWDKEYYYLNWDKGTDTRSLEGYRQLSLYFTQWLNLVRRNGWQGRVRQFLNDEPQIHNEMDYRALACIARELMPGIPIIEPIETPHLYGALDTWVVKQGTYEDRMDEFHAVQKLGKEFWYYTCAFPTGKIVDRLLDLPLLVTRYIGWIPVKYNMTGYLHWAYNARTGNAFENTCFPFQSPQSGQNLLLPAGSAGIVYPYEGLVLQSVRAMAISAGIEDYELLMQLKGKDANAALALVEQCITSFRDYSTDPAVFGNVRHELLTALL